MKFAVSVIMLSVTTSIFGEYIVQMQNGIPLLKNFVDAHAACVEKGLILATPDTDGKNDLLKEFITNHGITNVWISANDMIKEGEFQWWTTGQLVVNKNMWHAGNPSNATNEDCVILDHVHSILLWNDVLCTSLSLVVCQPASKEAVALAKSRIPMLQQVLDRSS